MSSGRYAGDGGLAIAASLNQPYGVRVDNSGNLYIADALNHRIRKVDAVTGGITTVAGGSATATTIGDGGSATSAILNFPQAVSLDAAGNLYIADTESYLVRKVTVATGVITTVAGHIGNGFGTGMTKATVDWLRLPRVDEWPN